VVDPTADPIIDVAASDLASLPSAAVGDIPVDADDLVACLVPIWAIAAAFASSVIAIYVGLGVLSESRPAIRVAVVAVGLLCAYFGYRSLGRRLRGAGFRAGLWLAVGWLGIVVLSALLAGVLPFTESKNPSLTFQEPVLASPDLLSRHPLGTDRQGLDVLGGIAYGFRVSTIVGLGSVALGLVIGGMVGTIAGYHRGRLDQLLEFFTNSLLAFPPLILLLGVAATMDRNVLNITVALAIVSAPVYVRLARATAIVVSQREFVVAARVLGARNRHIIRKDIAPGVLRPLLSYAFVMVAAMIVAEASLSFLGLGIARPDPTLGNMINAGQADFETYPHLVFTPATALFLTVLSLNLVGEELQRRWNPRVQKI
jgi:peptide/nickel transport system permease protein